MSITIYNTLTRTLEPFEPLEPGTMRMYVCGPTVYDFFHIGNARSFVMSDVVRRYFEYRGHAVTFVMNLTDVDDKIIRRANEQGVASSEIAETYAQAFLEDAARLGIRPATVHPRATENMDGIIAHIEGLVANGSAYVVDGDVYFRVASFPTYGRLSGKKVDELIAGARVEADTRKESAADFALWKSAKPGEPFWSSPWGDGRPGWHIECSVMSQKHLGETFDIHGGGNDLIFPHHENEIAQSEALTHHPLARYWMHFGFLNIDNEKMSKSLGNFFTTRDLLDRYAPQTLRFFYLQTHYRSPLNFTSDGLDAAARGLQKLDALMASLETTGAGAGSFDTAAYEQRFIEAVDNDINTPAGLGVLFECVRDANAVLRGGGLDASSRLSLQSFMQRTAGDIFGVLGGTTPDSSEATHADVEQLLALMIDVRARARAEKQWALSDLIRDGLRDIGFTLEDGKSGTTWKRI